MKTVAIIQARMGSTRLPNKVMKKLLDRTVLSHVINRLLACPRLDRISEKSIKIVKNILPYPQAIKDF